MTKPPSSPAEPMEDGVVRDSPHHPVMLQAVTEGLALQANEDIIDGTLGYGGHSEAFLTATGPHGRLLGIDKDPQALQFTQQRLGLFQSRCTFHQGSFADLAGAFAVAPFEHVDAFFLDLGVSSPQLDEQNRGFSFLHDGPLDMRMNPTQTRSAATLLQESSEAELADIFYYYGDERRSRVYARAIVQARRVKPLTTTSELADLILRHHRGSKAKHPATRVFQALRIAVNQELQELEQFLASCWQYLKPGGRIAILSYHSLEDRQVKRCFRTRAREGSLRLITPKPLTPSREEIQRNRRARSAKLRIAQYQEAA